MTVFSFYLHLFRFLWLLFVISFLPSGLETKSLYVAQTDFKVMITLPPPPEFWDSRQMPPKQASLCDRQYTS